MEEGTDRIRSTDGDNYQRLHSVKAASNSGDFLHVNQNIEPAT